MKTMSSATSTISRFELDIVQFQDQLDYARWKKVKEWMFDEGMQMEENFDKENKEGMSEEEEKRRLKKKPGMKKRQSEGGVPQAGVPNENQLPSLPTPARPQMTAVEDNTIPMPSCIIAHASLSQTGPTIPMSPLSSETKLYVKDGNQPALTGVGINPQCFIAPTFDTSQPSQHLGNITKDIASTFSFVLTLALIWLTHRRKAAVGRIKLRSVYAITLLLNAITTGAFLQGSAAFVVLTALHVGFVAAFFWGLLANAIVATQFVKDDA
ncbi:hypothetical protein C0989_009823 [Termitomyces sp. Mn162]|nr:hypothetical protein C0989_009823 [Termitomyces sp. Mn162]